MQDGVVLEDWQGFAPVVQGMPVDVEWALLAELDPVDGFQPPPCSNIADPYAADDRDPLDRIVTSLRSVDRAFASVLRDLVQAGPRDGLSVRRQVGLLAGATGSDVAFLDRAVEVLRAMPCTQTAFDDGLLTWSQVRGIVVEARRLSVAQRGVLDEALAGMVAQGRVRGEPDRVVEVCGDIAARLDAVGQERLEDLQDRSERLVLQFDFDGWADINGTLGPVTAATVAEALDAMADAPVAADTPPATDDDGRVLPKAARPPTSRAAQWATALGRMAALALGGTGSDGQPRRARPLVSVIARSPTCSTMQETATASGR